MRISNKKAVLLCQFMISQKRLLILGLGIDRCIIQGLADFQISKPSGQNHSSLSEIFEVEWGH